MRPSTLFSWALLALLCFSLVLPKPSQATGLAVLIPGTNTNEWNGTCVTGECSYESPCGLADNYYTVALAGGESSCILALVNATGTVSPQIVSTLPDKLTFSLQSYVSLNAALVSNNPIYFKATSPEFQLSGTIQTFWDHSLGWADDPLLSFSNMTLGAFSVAVSAHPASADFLPNLNIVFDRTTLTGSFQSEIPILNISTARWVPSGSPPVHVLYNNVTFVGANVAPALVGSDSLLSTTLEFRGGQGSIETDSLLSLPTAASQSQDLDVTLSFHSSKFQMGTTQLIKESGVRGLKVYMDTGADIAFGTFGAPVFDASVTPASAPSWTLNNTWSFLYGLDLSSASVIGCQACNFANCKFNPPTKETPEPLTKFYVSNLGTTSYIKMSGNFNPAPPFVSNEIPWNMRNIDFVFTESPENFGETPPTLYFYSDLPLGQSFLFENDVDITTSIGPNCTVIFDLKVEMTPDAALASGCSMIFYEGVHSDPSSQISAIATNGPSPTYPSLSLLTHKKYNVSFDLANFAYLNVNFTQKSTDSLALLTTVAASNSPLQGTNFQIMWPNSLGAPNAGERIDILSFTSSYVLDPTFAVPSYPTDLAFIGAIETVGDSLYVFYASTPPQPLEPIEPVEPPTLPPSVAPTIAPVAGSRCPSEIPSGFNCVNGVLVSEGSVTIGTGSNSTKLIVTSANIVIQGNLTVSNGSQIVFTNPTHIIQVQGCVELANGSIILIDLSQTKPADLPSGSHVLISQAESCSKSLQSVPIQITKPKNTCKKVSATKTNQQNSNSLTVLFVTDSSPCNTKWIIIGAVLGAVVVIAVIAVIVVYTVIKKKDYRQAKNGLRG